MLVIEEKFAIIEMTMGNIGVLEAIGREDFLAYQVVEECQLKSICTSSIRFMQNIENSLLRSYFHYRT